MDHFTTKEGFLFYSLPINSKEKRKIDAVLELLDRSGVEKYLSPDAKEMNAGRPEYDPYRLFAVIALGFALNSGSLREIESQCRNDLRFIYILGDATPSYSVICRFINKVILPHSNEIFTCIMKEIFRGCGISLDTCFLDGTKHEADANKYKFVWKPTAFHARLSDKTRNLLRLLHIDGNIPSSGFIPSALLADKVTDAIGLKPENLGLTEKTLSSMIENLKGYLLKTIEYEEKESICGPYRNSYYKTDHDATAMCLKEDYYSGLGSNMHAAYSVQFTVVRGLVANFYVSQERSDTYTLIPTIEQFKEMYGRYPENLVADSGYGCTANYRYCEENSIAAYIKYGDWQGERSGRRPSKYHLNDDDTITCLNGKTGIPTTLEKRHPASEKGRFYKVSGCRGCDFMAYCRAYMKKKKDKERIFDVPVDFVRYKQRTRDLLLSVKGIEMRVNRSCQVEGAFGIMKQNMMYRRARRISLHKVSNEVMLTCLGLNLRKYMRFALSGEIPAYWTAPKNLEPETFKNPSAKRLANTIRKREEKKAQKSTVVKSSKKYKYKSTKKGCAHST